MATIVDYDGPSVSKSEVSHGGEGPITAKRSRLCHLGRGGEAHAQDLVVRREPILAGSARGRCGVSFHAPELSAVDRRSAITGK